VSASRHRPVSVGEEKFVGLTDLGQERRAGRTSPMVGRPEGQHVVIGHVYIRNTIRDDVQNVSHN
jgi:hypothetical protein